MRERVREIKKSVERKSERKRKSVRVRAECVETTSEETKMTTGAGRRKERRRKNSSNCRNQGTTGKVTIIR